MTTEHGSDPTPSTDDVDSGTPGTMPPSIADPVAGSPVSGTRSTSPEPTQVEAERVEPQSVPPARSPESDTKADSIDGGNDGGNGPSVQYGAETGFSQQSTLQPGVAQPSANTPRVSVAAIVIGAIIIGLGLSGLVTGVSPLRWAAGFAIGLVTASAIATIGVLVAWRINDNPASR